MMLSAGKFNVYRRVLHIGFTTIIVCASCIANAQDNLPFPKDHAALNYVLIPFKAKTEKKAATYIFKVAEGAYPNQQEFDQHVNTIDTSNSPGNLLEIPFFGRTYTWQYRAVSGKYRDVYKSPLYSFTTLMAPWIDSAAFRIRVTHAQSDNVRRYMSLDYARCIFNEKGHPVWFLKNIPGVVNDSTLVRDLKQTSRGTLTFLNEQTGYEIDYSCNIIWKSPERSTFNPDSMNNLHHDFTRLANGHYMALGEEYVYRKVPDTVDSLFVKDSPNAKYENGQYYLKLRLGNILEWDSTGKLIWYWRSHQYFTDSFLFAGDARLKSLNISPHFNAFDADLDNNQVYASCRDISTLLRIDYSSRKVVNSYYGFRMNSTDSGIAVFNAQHSCKIGKDGMLYFFNNNSFADQNKPASVMFAKQSNDQLLKVREVSNPYVTEPRKNSMRGGNVVRTPEGDYLCDMGSINYCFRFNEAGQITWNAVIEKKTRQQWQPFTQYRIAAIDITKLFSQPLRSL